MRWSTVPLLFGEGELTPHSISIRVARGKLMVSRGVTNTRLRDFYDIHVLLGVKEMTLI